MSVAVLILTVFLIVLRSPVMVILLKKLQLVMLIWPEILVSRALILLIWPNMRLLKLKLV